MRIVLRTVHKIKSLQGRSRIDRQADFYKAALNPARTKKKISGKNIYSKWKTAH